VAAAEAKRAAEAGEEPAKLLEGVHVHDLRRTYGLRVARHAGILAASKLLRHSDARVTSRVYAPLGLDELRRVADAVNQPAPARVARFESGRRR
jgi:integrase